MSGWWITEWNYSGPENGKPEWFAFVIDDFYRQFQINLCHICNPDISWWYAQDGIESLHWDHDPLSEQKKSLKATYVLPWRGDLFAIIAPLSLSFDLRDQRPETTTTSYRRRCCKDNRVFVGNKLIIRRRNGLPWKFRPFYCLLCLQRTRSTETQNHR